jgi:phenylacetic acid degradation operon negative regulatory protein
MNPSPRTVSLSLMLGAEARGNAELSVRQLLAACALFSLPENAVRVALARAVAADLLTTPRRGYYTLGAKARPLAQEVSRWSRTGELMVDWAGDWVAVHVGATGRSDRAARRARERALGLLGFAEFEHGLHLRPNNLAGGVTALRARLQALVPQETATGTLFLLREMADGDEQRARQLWDVAALDATYRDTTAHLYGWLDNAHALPLDRAARESFQIGHDAIRQLMYDPLLPAPLIDAQARTRLISAVRRYDDAGRAIWQQFLAAVHSKSPLDGPLSLPFPFTFTQETTP